MLSHIIHASLKLLSRLLQNFVLCVWACTVLGVSATELDTRLAAWEAAALTCTGNGVAFPSKQTGEVNQPCDDGDMTLFNGILCVASEPRGCVGVAEAQDPVSGLWHRSPRIRFLGKNDRGDADFSPDMALGAQLYLLQTKDIVRAKKWLLWIHENAPCYLTSSGGCVLKGEPRFCSAPNCAIRPQDYATLAATVKFLQTHHGLEELPKGRLRDLLGEFRGYAEAAELVASFVNDPGFPQHLAGVGIWVLRKTNTESPLLDAAAEQLHVRNPGNAFFTFMARKPASQVEAETLARCTAEPSQLVRPLFQWQWERSSAADPLTGVFPWQQSSLWDCILMAKLLEK